MSLDTANFLLSWDELLLGSNSATFLLDRYFSLVDLCWVPLWQFEGHALRPGGAPGSSNLGPGVQQSAHEVQY
jgi:hypothetical protein